MASKGRTGRGAARRIAVRLAALGLVLSPSVWAVLSCTVMPAPPQGWLASRGPVVPHDRFPTDCGLCHKPTSWHEIRDDFSFDHERETTVALHGAHRTAECLRCHNDRGPVAQFAQRGCVGCHEDWHRGGLGPSCQDCHDESSWEPSEQIVRHNRTRFPLIGAHAGVACWRCHEGAQVGNFQRATTECAPCHRQDLARATSPAHVGLGWVDDCERCHTPTAWSGGAFQHRAFPLIGAHAAAACTQCHANDVFTGTPRECVGCHLGEYNAASDPSHLALGFPTQCEQCHTPYTWDGALFAHTTFPLTGAHAGADCSQCHVGGVFQGTPRDCVGCHRSEYDATTDPGHLAAGFSTQCDVCHSTASWGGATFAHTTFPLAGAHAAADCAQCHAGGVFQGTPSQCVSCHQAEYNATTSPNHASSGFSTDCAVCHDTTRWQGATFNHTFPLSGRHNFACTTCHDVPGRFDLFNCIGCHEHRQSEADSEHRSVSGYVWASTACFACHPNGRH